MRKTFFIFIALMLNHSYVYGNIITENANNGCNFNDTPTNLYATFIPNIYTCAAGYFLPLNHIDCIPCPSGMVCNGGTFAFNENKNQGIKQPNLIISNLSNGCDISVQSLYSIFMPNQHTCSAGYYMPANTDGCVECPANSYCPGGTYTFNETAPQGITACSTIDNGAYPNSVAGASSQSDCFYTCATSDITNATTVTGNHYYGGANTCAAVECNSGYHVGSDTPATCVPNSIEIIWYGSTQSDIESNNARYTVYGGPVRTPHSAPHVPGKTFKGWAFENTQINQ